MSQQLYSKRQTLLQQRLSFLMGMNSKSDECFSYSKFKFIPQIPTPLCKQALFSFACSRELEVQEYWGNYNGKSSEEMEQLEPQKKSDKRSYTSFDFAIYRGHAMAYV